MTLVELKKGLLTCMQSVYPTSEYKYYGVDTTEGYKRPSFMTVLRPTSISPANYNTYHFQVTLVITYFQELPDELDMLTKAEALRKAFGLSVKCTEKEYANVTAFDVDYVGTASNILQLNIDLDFFCEIVRTDDTELMEVLDLTLIKEEEE